MTGRPPLDEETKAVYAAEDAAAQAWSPRRYRTFAELTAEVERIVTSDWWAETFAGAPIEVYLERRSGTATFSAACRRDGTGVLWFVDGHHWSADVVCHELAHLATDSGHDAAFRAALVKLWRMEAVFTPPANSGPSWHSSTHLGRESALHQPGSVASAPPTGVGAHDPLRRRRLRLTPAGTDDVLVGLGLGCGSAARQRLHQDHLIGGVQRPIEIIFDRPVHEYPHVLANSALLVDQPEAQPGMATVQVKENLAQGGAIGRHLAGSVCVGTQRRGD